MGILKRYVSLSIVWCMLAIIVFSGVLTLPIPGAVYAYAEHSGTISTNQTWHASDNPHVVTGNVLVEGAGLVTLTIEPGCMVKFNPATGLSVGRYGTNTGALNAQGTEGNPIIFTSNAASPTLVYRHINNETYKCCFATRYS
ncbi:MAG: hypothetical protein L3J18_14640 [Candidatus Brocadia sp.]|jgi:hypothetical protein|uniref:Uncharacterized protein n=1 Tax=Candidatus Brocadia fulgida TaxID=380242 RepID=A0A0M2UWE3_9BACT|nr:MAG: hypothetical protein BROFUL_00885 [Candidatus Brocadia fulgida]UJS20119.1 MAG: hypothetical protein L3J18_14640 [Candidatus Brocadia sp.]